jgi:hypothetical protein
MGNPAEGLRPRAVVLRIFLASILSGTLVGLALGVFMCVLAVRRNWNSFNSGMWLPVFSADFFQFIRECAPYAAEGMYLSGLMGLFGGAFGGVLPALLCRKAICQRRLLLLMAVWAATPALAMRPRHMMEQ